MFTPEQELYNYFYKFSKAQGYNTYGYLPMESENAQYPFVIIGNSQTLNSITKSNLSGSIIQTIEFWNDVKDRATVSTMFNDFVHAGIKLNHTDNYNFRLETGQTEQNSLIDTSVPNEVLLHGILDLHIQIL